jgi:hypothetical protein
MGVHRANITRDITRSWHYYVPCSGRHLCNVWSVDGVLFTTDAKRVTCKRCLKRLECLALSQINPELLGTEA